MTEKFLTAHQFTNLVKSVIPLRHEFFWRFSLLDHQEMALKKHQNEINCSLKTVIKCYSNVFLLACNSNNEKLNNSTTASFVGVSSYYG